MKKFSQKSKENPICHRVSHRFMASVSEPCGDMQKIYNMVYTLFLNSRGDDTNVLHKYITWVDKIESILKGIYNHIEGYLLEAYVSRIMDLLYNEEYNLQIGNRAWNISIADAFDAFEDYDNSGGKIVLGQRILKL